jgi:hypothetical protein
MYTLYATVEEIRSTLDQLRQNPQTKRRFPKKLWDSIIQLTKNYSFDDICSQLDINPVYLKRKICQATEDGLEFHEVTFAGPVTSNNEVKIELSSRSGLKAMIQGPISCLDCLHKLFGE